LSTLVKGAHIFHRFCAAVHSGGRGIGAAFAILIVTFVGYGQRAGLRAAGGPPTHNHTQTVDAGLDDPHRGGVLIAMGVLTADAAQSTNESRIFPRR
jgi:hypothetical protein